MFKIFSLKTVTFLLFFFLLSCNKSNLRSPASEKERSQFNVLLNLTNEALNETKLFGSARSILFERIISDINYFCSLDNNCINPNNLTSKRVIATAMTAMDIEKYLSSEKRTIDQVYSKKKKKYFQISEEYEQTIRKINSDLETYKEKFLFNNKENKEDVLKSILWYGYHRLYVQALQRTLKDLPRHESLLKARRDLSKQVVLMKDAFKQGLRYDHAKIKSASISGKVSQLINLKNLESFGKAWTSYYKENPQTTNEDLELDGEIESYSARINKITFLDNAADVLNFLAEKLVKNYDVKLSLVFPNRNVAQDAIDADDEDVKPSKVKRNYSKIQDLILVGKIPGEYYQNKGDNRFSNAESVLSLVKISKRKIVSFAAIQEQDVNQIVAAEKQKNPKSRVVILKNKINQKFDIIYPGLIDLHNHTKQNNLGVWADAKGQFANRFEWRKWNNYDKSVSQNMNPWVGYGAGIKCAAFRWSHMQAMVMGTTLLQGASSCVDAFTIRRVEDADSYLSPLAAVQAPTDLVYPLEMEFVWDEFVARNGIDCKVENGQTKNCDIKKTYEQVMTEAVHAYCPSLKDSINENNISQAAGLKILKVKENLTKACTQPNLPNKMIRYLYFIHPTVAGKKNYLKNKNMSAIIAHLAEGRRDDPYNQKEYLILKMLGLAETGVNFIHGVGITSEDHDDIVKKKIGLVWSPFSNLILYNQTLDVEKVLNQYKNSEDVVSGKDVPRIALGSDWLPTGTKGVLEEAKVAKDYVDKFKLNITDQDLFYMMTKWPAAMISHLETAKDKSGVGQIRENDMAHLIAISDLSDVSATASNPYTNIVRFADERHVNLVVVDGEVVYGNESYLKDQMGIAETQLEAVNNEVNLNENNLSSAFNLTSDLNPSTVVDGKPITPGLLLNKIGNKVATNNSAFSLFSNSCDLQGENKMMVVLPSIKAKDLQDFEKASGLNLDKFSDINKLIAVNITTQSKNALGLGDKDFAVKNFTPLLTCNDKAHTERTRKFIFDQLDKDTASRDRLIKDNKFGRTPKALADIYQFAETK